MIYVDNDSTYSQRIFIPREEELGSTDVTGHTVTLQRKDYEIHENGLTRIHPDAGFDGISAGTIGVYVSAATGVTFEHLDVTEDGIYVPTGDTAYSGVTVQVYDGAYQDGYNDGYASGYTVGYQSGYTRGNTEGYLSGQTDGYASGHVDGYNEGYSSGHTEGYAEGRSDGYSEGYASGSTDGYQEGYRVGYAAGYADGRTEGYQYGLADGAERQKALLTAETFTENGTYTREDGWSAVTISIPDGPYQEGFEDGVAHQKSLLDSLTVTVNGITVTSETGYSAVTTNLPMAAIMPRIDTNGVYSFIPADFNLQGFDGLEITVDVPTSGGSSVLTAVTATTNGVYTPPTGIDGFSSVRVDVQLDTASTYDSGYTSGYTSGMTDGYASGYTEGVAWRDAQDIPGVFYANGTYRRQNGYGWSEVTVRVDTAATYTSGYTDGSNYQKGLLGSTAFTQNGSYTNANGWSAVTVQAGGITGATEISLDSLSKNIPSYGTYYFVFDEHTDLNTIMLTFGNTADTSVACTYNITTVGENRIIANASSAAWMKVNGQIVPPEETWTFGSTGLKTIPWGCKGRTSYMYTPTFVGISTLVSVVIGSGVTNVESGSFMDCQNLTAVTFETGSKLRGIAGMSFQNCVNLSSITFPSTLEYIEYTAFHSCRRLSEITCLATTAPELRDGSVFGQLVPENGTLRVPTGSDYSTWLAQLPSGWTIQYI